MSDKSPCDLHPDLEVDRVRLIGKIIKDARNGARLEHNPEAGDTSWSTSCRGFSWAWQRLLGKAGTEGYEWLSTVDSTMHYVGAIGSVPFRFYHGDSKKPKNKFIEEKFSQRQQFNLDLGAVPAHQDLIFLFAAETDVQGVTERVIFAAVQPNGYVISSIDATSDAPIPAIAPIHLPEESGVELGAAKVSGKRTKQKKTANGDTH